MQTYQMLGLNCDSDCGEHPVCSSNSMNDPNRKCALYKDQCWPLNMTSPVAAALAAAAPRCDLGRWGPEESPPGTLSVQAQLHSMFCLLVPVCCRILYGSRPALLRLQNLPGAMQLQHASARRHADCQGLTC